MLAERRPLDDHAAELPPKGRNPSVFQPGRMRCGTTNMNSLGTLRQTYLQRRRLAFVTGYNLNRKFHVKRAALSHPPQPNQLPTFDCGAFSSTSFRYRQPHFPWRCGYFSGDLVAASRLEFETQLHITPCADQYHVPRVRSASDLLRADNEICLLYSNPPLQSSRC